MDWRRGASAALALVLSAAAGCAATLEEVGPQQAADRARPGVERVRELRFLAPVGAREQTREERKAELAAELARSDEATVAARVDRQLETLSYQLFGMLPVHVDLERAMPQASTDNLAGYYDTEEKNLTLIRGSSEAAAGVVGHELVHALQDQHFDIGEARRATRDNDAAMALRALIEGDATLAGLDFGSLRELQAASMADDERRGVILASLSLSRFAEELENRSPLLLIENKWFRYEGGFGFVSAVHADLGWAGVDALYADPPESTEQILYPERYLDRRERPVSIELAAPPDGWQLRRENDLGLFETRLLLRGRGVWFADAIASAWDGDRYALWEGGGEDGGLALVWYTVWSGPREAARFARAYAASLARLDPTAETWAVATEDRVVAVVPAAPPGRAAELLAQLRRSRWSPPPDAAPPESFWRRLATYPLRVRRLDRVREVSMLGDGLLRYRGHDGGSRLSVLGGLALHALSRPGQLRVDLAGGLLGLRSNPRGDRELKLLPALRGYLRDDGAFDLHLLEDPLFGRSALRIGRSAELDVVELAFALRWRREPDRVQLSLPFGLLDYTQSVEGRRLRALRVPFTSRWLVCAGCAAQ